MTANFLHTLELMIASKMKSNGPNIELINKELDHFLDFPCEDASRDVSKNAPSQCEYSFYGWHGQPSM